MRRKPVLLESVYSESDGRCRRRASAGEVRVWDEETMYERGDLPPMRWPLCGTLPGPPLALSQESIRRGLRLRHMDALQHFCTLRRGDLSPVAPTQMEDRNLAHKPKPSMEGDLKREVRRVIGGLWQSKWMGWTREARRGLLAYMNDDLLREISSRGLQRRPFGI